MTGVQTCALPIFELVREALPLLKAGTDSSVVLVGSIAGLSTVRTGIPYGASKAALKTDWKSVDEDDDGAAGAVWDMVLDWC